jgi:activator of 2-hydroxyglutaryl-CoA dehydratase
VDTLSREMGFGVLVPEGPQTLAALGAAMLAREAVEKGTR